MRSSIMPVRQQEFVGRIGKKAGMTRIYEASETIPVTVIYVGKNEVVQKKNVERDGYNAVQLAFDGDRLKPQRLTKALKGHFAKSKIKPARFIKEFPASAEVISEYKEGSNLDISVFENVPYVDVTGVSKGKGFAGTIKRYNFRGQDSSHGNSKSHRKMGSTGQNQSPGKVFKGKKMPGRMGGEQVTVQSLQLVKVDAEAQCLWVRGAIPGPTGSIVYVTAAVKQSNEKKSKG